MIRALGLLGAGELMASEPGELAVLSASGLLGRLERFDGLFGDRRKAVAQ